MKKKKLVKQIAGFGVLALLLGAGISLNLSMGKTRNKESRIQAVRGTKLEVALVNEDQEIEADGKKYQLGNSYIKKLEKDDSQNWTVVSRGAAEKGLEEGKYQLMLVIPSDFSSKVLDIKETHAEEAMVTYQVNGAGNLQLENEANQLAKDMVADLNKQLVDMYMAAILSNLYTAQKNVETVTGIESQNIAAYKTNLYQTAMGQKNNFPGLVNLSAAALSSNDSLKKSLEAYDASILSMQDSQGLFTKNLESLMQRRQEDSLTQAEFTKELLEMDGTLLSEDSQKILTDMETAQQELEKALGKAEDKSPESSSLQSLTADYQAEFQKVKDALSDERKALDAQKAQLSGFVAKKLTDYYGLSEGSGLTLKDLTAKDPQLAGLLAPSKNLAQDQLKQVTSQLPASDPSSLGTAFQDLTFDAQGAEELLGTISYNTGLAAELKVLEDQKETAEDALKKEMTQGKSRADITVTIKGAGENTVLEYESDSGEKLADLTNNQKQENLPLGGKIKISYQGAAQEVDLPLPQDLNGSDNKNQKLKVPGQTVELDVAVSNVEVDGISEQTKQNYEKAVGDLTRQEASIRAHYIEAQILLDTLYPKDSSGKRKELGDTLLQTDLTKVVTDLLIYVVTSNLDDYAGQIGTNQANQTGQSKDKLRLSIDDLTSLEGQITDRLKTIDQSNQTILEQIRKQKDQADSLTTKMSALKNKNSAYKQSLDDTDAAASGVSNDLSSLMSATSSTRETSSSTIQLVEGVNQTFSSMNQELESAKSNTEKLSQDAENLMNDFDSELATSGDFVASFSKVFNNAYQNGVPNEALLTFLSSPVKHQASSKKASLPVRGPFTWILLLELVTLFAAYVLASQGLSRKARDSFEKPGPVREQGLTVLVLAIGSLLLGLVIGILSAQALQITQTAIPSWVFTMTLASYFLVQLQYGLLRKSRVLGMGLVFFVLMTYVYLSNSLGGRAGIQGFWSWVKNLNPLSALESNLLLHFDGGSSSLLFVFIFFSLSLAVTLSHFLIKSED